jgi:hypothetical protein
LKGEIPSAWITVGIDYKHVHQLVLDAGFSTATTETEIRQQVKKISTITPTEKGLAFSKSNSNTHHCDYKQLLFL